MVQSLGPLITGAWLAEHRNDPDLRIIDFRSYLDGRSGRAAYDAGHVPGAVFVDLDGEVTGHRPNAGRHHKVEPIDPVAGHIPGALSAFYRDNLTAQGRFRPPEELRRRFAALGVRESKDVASYCGPGVTACHNLLALEVAGLAGGRLYPGSWSEWCVRPDAPVATGKES